MLLPNKGGKYAVDPSQNTRSAKSGLTFPVGRIFRFLKKGNYTERISSSTPIYMSAVLEYLCAEILELSGNAAIDNKRHRITPRHITLAIKNDEEFDKLFGNAIIINGGVAPNINPALLPNANKKKGKKSKSSQSSQSIPSHSQTFD